MNGVTFSKCRRQLLDHVEGRAFHPLTCVVVKTIVRLAATIRDKVAEKVCDLLQEARVSTSLQSLTHALQPCFDATPATLAAPFAATVAPPGFAFDASEGVAELESPSSL